jgi:hypothetical protein
MTTTKTIRQTVNALVKSYRDEIKDAANNNVLTRAEQKVLSPWTRRHINELRQDVDTVTIAKAVAHLRPIITRAAQSIAGADHRIDADDVKKLRVMDLRLRAVSLFVDENDAKAALDKALNAASIPAISDLGKSFGFATHPKNASVESILGDITGYDMGEMGDDWFNRSSGARAVNAFAESMAEAGKIHAEGSDGPSEAEAIIKAFDGVSASLTEYFKGADFKKFVYADHSIAEDGDVHWDILLAQKTDGSWASLAYSDFPF